MNFDKLAVNEKKPRGQGTGEFPPIRLLASRGVRLALIGAALAGFPGCAQNNVAQKTGPGALPGQNADAPVTDADGPRLNATTYLAHAHLLERQGNFEDAERQYRQALELKPDFATARNRLGITLNKLGRHGEATAEFRKAVAQQPGQTHLQNNLGFSLYLEGKYEEAERILRQTVEMKPSFGRARLNHALSLAKLQRFDDAFTELRQCGSEADAYYNLAMMQTEAGHFADAARALDAALRLEPKFEAARQQLREVARLAAERPEAAQAGDVTVLNLPNTPSAPAPVSAAPSVLAPAAIQQGLEGELKPEDVRESAGAAEVVPAQAITPAATEAVPAPPAPTPAGPAETAIHSDKASAVAAANASLPTITGILSRWIEAAARVSNASTAEPQTAQSGLGLGTDGEALRQSLFGLLRGAQCGELLVADSQ